MLEQILRIGADLGKYYYLNGFDIKRYVSDFPRTEEGLKQLSRLIGKPLLIKTASDERYVPKVTRKHPRFKTKNNSGYEKEPWIAEVLATPDKISCEMTKIEIKGNRQIVMHYEGPAKHLKILEYLF